METEKEILDSRSGGTPGMPKNYLTEAILVTLFCCLPLGVVSIIFASKVDSEYRKGNYEEAQKASEEAQKYMKWGLIGGIVGVVLYLIIIMVVVVAEGGF